MISLDNDENDKENSKMKRLSFSSQSSYDSDDDNEDDLDNINKMYDINNYQDMGLDLDNEIEESLFGATSQQNFLLNMPLKEMQSISDKNSLHLDDLPKKKVDLSRFNKKKKNPGALLPLSNSSLINTNQFGNKHQKNIINSNILSSPLNKDTPNKTITNNNSTLTYNNNNMTPLSLTKLTKSSSNSNLNAFNLNQFKKNQSLEENIKKLNEDLQKKNDEIKKLKQKLSDSISSKSIEKSISEVISPQWNGTEKDKILQLAKKARNLTIALEKERGLNASLNNKLKQMETEGIKKKKELKKQNSNSELNELKQDKKNLKERLNQMTLKLEQERINNQKLTFEIRNTQRALVQEVGEDIPISKILDSNGGYIGRSQQIAMLKDKVNQLTRQLSNYVSLDETKGLNTKELKLDSRHRFDIKKKEIDRKITLEKAIKEIEELKNEKHNQKLKCDAVQARNKNLEKTMKDYKTKISVLISKTETDDKLIKALKQQLADLKKSPQNKLEGANLIKNNKSFETLRNLCNEQKSKIKFQEDKISSLSNQLKTIISSISLSDDNGSLIQKDKTCDNPHCHLIFSQFKAIYIENIKLNELKTVADKHIKELEEKLANSLTKSSKNEKDKNIYVINNNDNIEKIKEKLIIAKDENNALKSIIDANLKEKTEEIKIYQDMLKQTKQNFLKDIEIIKRNFSKVNPTVSSTSLQKDKDLTLLKASNNNYNNDIPTII
ncbi:hypothetical protein BCR36DRAFT_349132 [Piromyces finnis]|uniref:Uncharacterized protein n=1 Tax=Piromyces finnis TaxID=1754191 RepID=A0A1Y1VD42_9FUNG|nr:hypothetical protein BCR36DRAFT_349132 [Piromyces finnis]|eukprot:ORX53320.1 hypothetical protein BCR36DRAFT_349132 [Piromyces finnis]